MIRSYRLVLALLLLGITTAFDATAEKRVDLLAAAKACQETWRQEWQDQQDYPGFFEELFESAPESESPDQDNWRDRSNESLASSQHAGDHLFRYWMAGNNVAAARDALQQAFYLDPYDPLVLRSLAGFCLREDHLLCTEVVNHLVDSAKPTADGLILAAALRHRSGYPGVEALYQEAASLHFSNSLGQQLAVIWPVVQQLDNEASEYEQVTAAFGISMAIRATGYSGELVRVCASGVEEPPYEIDPSLCHELATRLAFQGSNGIDRVHGIVLLDKISAISQDPIDLEQAARANLERMDLQNRFLGLSCNDDRRLGKDQIANENYLMSVVRYGEINIQRALVEQFESGVLH